MLCVLGSGQATAGLIIATSTATWAKVPLGTPGVPGEFLLIGGEVIASTLEITRYEYRGIAEFDLNTLSPVPNSSVILQLPDTGGKVLGDSTTDIYYFVGDGVAGAEDYFRSDTFLIQVTRPWKAGATHHDATTAVNSVALGGHRYIGVLFVGVTGQDAFGYADRDVGLTLTFSDVAEPPAAVPEPSTLALAGIALAGGCLPWWKRRRTFRRA
jgi:hypothetical protein